MNKESMAAGIRRFAEQSDANLSQEGGITFEVTFPGAEPPAIIGIENLGFVMSYATYCRSLPDTELAPTLLRRNWGGVESTCFYFSVNVDDGVPWLILETRQFLDSRATSDDVASMLALWRLQCKRARESLQK
jgi:hypothetical protein